MTKEMKDRVRGSESKNNSDMLHRWKEGWMERKESNKGSKKDVLQSK